MKLLNNFILEKLTLNKQSQIMNVPHITDYIMAFINIWKHNKFIKDIEKAINDWVFKFYIKDIQKCVYAINCGNINYTIIKNNIDDRNVNKTNFVQIEYRTPRRKKNFNKDVIKIYNSLKNDYCVGDVEVLFHNDGIFDEDIYVIGNHEGLLITVMVYKILFLTNNN